MPVASSSVLFQNAAGQLSADPAGFLRSRWFAGPRTLADTQAFCTHITQGLQQYGYAKVLVFQADMKPFSPAEQEWVTREWLPHAVQQGGYRYGAIVVSPDTYTRLATAYITTNVSNLPMRYRSFDEEEAAIAWLDRQPG